jgi:nitrous oxide reductase accessory protein NosL
MNLKTVISSLFFLFLFSVLALTAMAQDDIQQHRSCTHCGMDRKAYGYSRALVSYADGGQVGVCSLNCAVIEMDSNKGRAMKSLQVADRDTHALLDAEKAYWLIGGSKRGVMTKRPKWAFTTESAARNFSNAYGGTIITWDEALKAAREDAGLKKP